MHREFIKRLNKLQNDMIPEVTLNCREFNFGKVHYNTPITKTLIVENTGRVIVEFMFQPNPNTLKLCKKWLRIKPINGILLPGEKQEISVRLNVDNETAPALNLGNDKLEDIIILHLRSGRDFFLAVQGEWVKSCFGNTLENLVTMQTHQTLSGNLEQIDQSKTDENMDEQQDSEQIEKSKDPKLQSDNESNQDENQQILQIKARIGKVNEKCPMQLIELVEYIKKNGITTVRIFDEISHPY